MEKYITPANVFDKHKQLSAQRYQEYSLFFQSDENNFLNNNLSLLKWYQISNFNLTNYRQTKRIIILMNINYHIYYQINTKRYVTRINE